MRYYKTYTEDNIVCISTMDQPGKGNIDEKEYKYILELMRKLPKGMLLAETEKGYEYVKAPDDPSKGGLDPDQAWKIISSSNISKEDKEKLYKYIYAKEELK